MSAAEVIAQIEALPEAERAQVAEETIRRLSLAEIRKLDRIFRRLAHPDVPEEIWEGYEDYEDGRFVDPDLVLREEPPPTK